LAIRLYAALPNKTQEQMIGTILHSHLSRYPAMQIQDVYKLLHQAAMGSEHAISHLESARNWLKRELAEMGEGPPEPLLDPISPNGKIVRVHLRPFVAAGHDPDVLLDAFIRTANEHHGDVRLLEQFWQVAIATPKFPSMEMEEFIRSMKADYYPAVHHSTEFEKLYRPAYRVVALAFCPVKWL
jgi:hypothetical protein